MKKYPFLIVVALILLITPTQTHANWLTDKVGSLFSKSAAPSSPQGSGGNACGSSGICKNLTYASGKNLLMDLYLPTNGTNPAGAILFLHPGSWSGGSKGDCTTDGNTPQSFVTKLRGSGFAVACINYSLTNTAHFPTQVQESKAAVRYLRANAGKYGLDANKIGALGLSAGGNMAALLGTSAGDPNLEGNLGNPSQSSAVQATDLVVGPTFFLPVSQISDGSQNSAIFAYLGGDPSKSQSALINATLADAARYVNGDEGPFLLQYGNQDTLVPPLHGQHLDTALKGKGRNSTFKTYNGGHGSFPWEDEMVSFFVSSLGVAKSNTPPVSQTNTSGSNSTAANQTPAAQTKTSWFSRFFGGAQPTSNSTPAPASTPAPTSTTGAPTITLSAKPAIVASGKSTTISWSATNATQCVGKVNGVTVPAGTSGSINSGPLTADASILFTCAGPGGTTQKTLNISVFKFKQ